MNNNLNIVIIGASRGIGREVVKQLHSEGHNLFCISRNKQALDNLNRECTGISSAKEINTLAFDIAELTESSYDIYGQVREAFNRIDILWYNAGFLIKKEFAEFNTEEIIKTFTVNVMSAAAVIRELLPLMGGKQPSHIVNTSSMGGYQGSAKFPGLSLYSSSKAALASLSECLAEEFKDKNIKVNCLALGAVQTEMLEEAFPGYKAPLSAAEMAEFISHFMVTGHKFFNGKILPVSASTP